ncbi:MAG: outer membrane beta-barrel protein [Bacteroidia bacterium]|jgi:hypothetical protein|nr:outer membrane beta-barrel protein [Bacteroidia bacterium]
MRKLILLAAVLSAPLLSRAQYYWEFGGGIGAANLLGEMGGDELTRRDFVADMKLNQTRQSASGFARYKLTPIFSIKSGINYVAVRGADSLSSNIGRNTRNLSVRNHMFEAYSEFQWFFFEINDLGRTYRYKDNFRAYIGAGIGAMYHNPQAYYQGEWVNLRPLTTEGVRYTAVTMTLPVSGGFYFTINKKYRLGWNLCWRTTMSDYLDDISDRYVDPSVLPSPMAVALANRAIPSDVDPAAVFSHAPGQKRGDPTHRDSFLTSNIEFSYVYRGKSSIYKSKYSHVFRGQKYKKRKVRAKF